MKVPALRIELKAENKVGEIEIYGTIGQDWFGDGVSPKKFKQDVDALGELDRLNVHVHSYGGSVFEGWAIYNTLESHAAQVHVYVDGSAMSMASVILQAADVRHIAKNGTVMIHNPVSIAFGGADEFRKAAEHLDKIRDQIIDVYMEKSTASREEVARMMDEETYMNAEEALKHGFVDVIGDEVEQDEDAVNALFAAHHFQMSGKPAITSEGLPMSTDKIPAAPDVSNLTPEQAQARATDATNAERKRVSDILALSRPGIEAFVQNLATSDIEASEAKIKVADKLMEIADGKIEARRQDSNQVVAEENQQQDQPTTSLKDQWEKNTNKVQDHFLSFDDFQAYTEADSKGLIKMLGGAK